MAQSPRPGALVTGGGIRLGQSIALALAQCGYDIVLHYRHSHDAAQRTAERIQDSGVHCHLLPADLADLDGFDAFIAQASRQCPSLSVLINNASGYIQRTIAQTGIDEFDTLFRVNLRAPFFLTRAFAAQVGSGNVINIVDNKIGFNQYQYAAYVLTKKALAEFTRLAAIEYAPRMRINALAPGVVMPADSRGSDYLAWRVSGIPLGRQGRSHAITLAISHLLQNDFITGQILTVDGGENIAHVGRNVGNFS